MLLKIADYKMINKFVFKINFKATWADGIVQ